MILFSVMFSMFLFSASSLFVHTLLYMSFLSTCPPLSSSVSSSPREADKSSFIYLF